MNPFLALVFCALMCQSVDAFSVLPRGRAVSVFIRQDEVSNRVFSYRTQTVELQASSDGNTSDEKPSGVEPKYLAALG